MDAFQFLQSWYKLQCNGEWEHQCGITLESLDNPGWRIQISLAETDLENEGFARVDFEASDSDWYHCWVEEKTFHGACSSDNLNKIFEIFQKFASGNVSFITGKKGAYFWMESRAIKLSDLLFTIPEIVEAKHVVRTYFDSGFLIPYGPNQTTMWGHWSRNGLLGILASPNELNLTNNDEYYVFDESPDSDKFRILCDDDFGLTGSFLRGESAFIFWQKLAYISPNSYLSGGAHCKFATKDEQLFNSVLSCDIIKNLPLKKTTDSKKKQQMWFDSISIEEMPEECAAIGCKLRRIRYGIYCPKHHMSMLKQTNPKD